MIIIFASAFAIGFAGRVHAEEGKDNRLENTTFENNTAKSGGAIYWHDEGITDIPFKNNTAGTGGAIYWQGEDITDIPFKDNTAGTGGAIFVG